MPRALAVDQARVVVIFSLGGLTLRRHLRSGAVRCCTGYVALDGSRQVVLDPFPERGRRGSVVDGRVRVWRDDVEVPPEPERGVRWDDHRLVEFAARTLCDWIALPLRLDGAAPGRHELDGGEHVLWVAADGRVTRHQERTSGHVHELSGHCELEGVRLATRRRTRDRRGIPLLWADVVAGHAFATESLK